MPFTNEQCFQANYLGKLKFFEDLAEQNRNFANKGNFENYRKKRKDKNALTSYFFSF